MPITVSGTSITFNDATVQTTAATSTATSSGTTFQAFYTSGTFTVPTGITKIQVVVFGGGGGGAVGYGGQGGIGSAYISGLTPGATISVTVGGGGNGATGSTGATGGTSSFGSYISCTGGSGGLVGGGLSGANGTATFSGVSLITGKNTVFNPIVGAGTQGGSGGYNPCAGGLYGGPPAQGL